MVLRHVRLLFVEACAYVRQDEVQKVGQLLFVRLSYLLRTIQGVCAATGAVTTWILVHKITLLLRTARTVGVRVWTQNPIF